MAFDPPPVDWRAAILRVDRVKICQYMMSRLSSLYSTVNVDAVRAQTSAFEAKVFHRANSRSDYVEQIAEGLTKAQNPHPRRPSVTAPDPPPGDWRAAILRVDRVKICQHVLSKLSSIYSTVNVDAVGARTSAFEAKVFHRANSRSDYLYQIAEGLTKAQNAHPRRPCVMAPDPPPVDWRAAILRVDRVKICQHVLSKLSSIYSTVNVDAVRARTSAFEAKVFHRANSRSDYLKQIAEGLTKAQNPGQHQRDLGLGQLRYLDGGSAAGAAPTQQDEQEQYVEQGEDRTSMVSMCSSASRPSKRRRI